MTRHRSFWKLFAVAALPQVALFVLLLTVGLGSDTRLFNAVMAFYAPVAYPWGWLMDHSHSNSWRAIGLFIIGAPAVGIVLYSLAFAFLAQWLSGDQAQENEA